ncbi:putative SAM-dependent methyltransferase [Bradyrhizobium sp. ORS 285]|uniref:class I SAM-dependent methyltransferase n=1 Tax=Bradyrhizobium sp. ORS 285 TaxID=115808 RepID=UPI0002408948|nr:class I SAM-dependent methyltransferase [Bradyrhizobium sp. ORS 285]CCD84528.1 putative SAM-dependent methyltransferase [Bradyrhizobium sp. ORS 285]SMX57509.1 putative SAM-dependent methyltransferase [Bradyrhizobium sp. ORS 285]
MELSLPTAVGTAPKCRHCGDDLTLKLIDLGASPVANDYVDPAHYMRAEPFYPLETFVCRECRLAQTRDLLAASDIFRADYAYFSSHSTSWLEHARSYVEAMAGRFGLGPASRHVEIASNDGYLLQYSLQKGINCLGVEPCESVAKAARAKGIATRIEFFGRDCARVLREEGWSADLLTANNVLAHVPDINDFVGGVKILLAPEGVATFEVQHLLTLMQRHQFDTIYHEHFSYLSLIAGLRIFARAGLRVFDVELPETHGGSIRFFVCHDDASHAESSNVADVLARERAYGLHDDAIYVAWNEQVKETKRALIELLTALKRDNKKIVAYGAPAKGVTLLNYCGIRTDFLDFTVDRAPSKQGRYMPGVRVPILPPEAIFEAKPDYVLILPWNIKNEIKTQMAEIRRWGGRFVVPVPKATIED